MSKSALLDDNIKEFERFLAEEARVVLGLARRLMGDGEAAKDLAQDALLKAHQALPRFRGESSLKTWVLKITVNEGLKRLRRRRLKDRVAGWLRSDSGSQAPRGYGLSRSDNPEKLAGLRQEARDLAVILDTLPPRQRTVLVLRHMEGLSIPEIAHLMGVGQGTVKTHLTRAVRKVRQARKKAGQSKSSSGGES